MRLNREFSRWLLPSAIVALLVAATYAIVGVSGEQLPILRLWLQGGLLAGLTPALWQLWRRPAKRWTRTSFDWSMLATGLFLSESVLVVATMLSRIGSSPPFGVWMLSEAALAVFMAPFVESHLQAFNAWILLEAAKKVD